MAASTRNTSETDAKSSQASVPHISDGHRAASAIRVFAPGGYTNLNTGDGLLLIALNEALKRVFGDDVMPTYLTTTPELDRAALGLDVEAYLMSRYGRFMRFGGALARRVGARGGVVYLGIGWGWIALMRSWLVVERLSPRLANSLLPQPILERIRALRASDAVVSVPGGYFLSPTALDAAWLNHWIELSLAVMLKRPTVLGPCSLGPFHGPQRKLMRWLFERVDGIALREGESEAHVRGTGYRGPLIRTTDAGFGVDLLPPGGASNVPTDRPLIGVSVRWFHFAGSPDPAAAQHAYFQSVADAVSALIGDGGGAVFVPQVRAAADDDIAAAREVVALMPSASRARVSVKEENVTPYEAAALYASFDLLIGTRMHANIISMLVGTPAVAIAYEHKTTGIMNELGLDDLVIDIAQCNADALLTRSRAILRDRPAASRRVQTAAFAARTRLEIWETALRSIIGTGRS
ncbi:MAG: colanic acid/amylovoran biosynthesis protein [Actinomycetota bacterium]|nr:colanic acid/amylovoran biosynthesis protein [Actinomycetota bacterium]